MLRPNHSVQHNFSLAQARSIVRDLFTPNPKIYWMDFLTTILSGHFLAAAVRSLPEWLGRSDNTIVACQAVCFVVSSLLYYRAALFIHELVHLPHNKFRGFRLAWNLLCGIPFMIPSFVYYTHIDHHRRKHFGTQHDGEYLPLGLHGWGYIAAYLALCPIIPIAGLVRFAILTPLTWLHPTIRNWVHKYASSMVMDPTYLRPLPTAETLKIIRLQEVACFLFCIGVLIFAYAFERPLISFLIQAYATGVFVVTLNAFRTMGAHRWWHEGEELTFVEQMLDSVTIADNGWITELWGPVGTRYHALHHLFPSMPYHAMPEAHKRLMAQLPADSPYRLTVEPSLTAALSDLLRRSKAIHQAEQNSVEKKEYLPQQTMSNAA